MNYNPIAQPLLYIYSNNIQKQKYYTEWELLSTMCNIGGYVYVR